GEALALEPAAHEEKRRDITRNAGLAARGTTGARRGLRVESREVHAVVDDAHAGGRHAVEPLDLRLSHARDRDDARRACEHLPLEGENDGVVDPTAAPPTHGQPRAMAALPCAVDVLPQP